MHKMQKTELFCISLFLHQRNKSYKLHNPPLPKDVICCTIVNILVVGRHIVRLL